MDLEIMPAKRKFKLQDFLEVLNVKSLSTGIIAHKLKCHRNTAIRYLRELKVAALVIEKRISNTVNMWKLTGKRIMLIDVDSTIPNLALLKISSFFKLKGDNVKLVKLKLKRFKDGTLKSVSKVDFSDKPDQVYVSVIYKKNKPAVDYLVSQHPDLDIDIGGSGYDLKKKLPDYIEDMTPDYSLYPEFDYSIGFSTRGCFRKCHFCVVPTKEGMFKKVNHPETWYNPEYGKIVFLDNNILTNRKHFMRITDWCIEKGLSVWFTQGLDIRRVNSTIARRLLELKHFRMIAFAWDDINDEDIIKQKINVFKENGFTKNKLRAYVSFYVYVDSDAEYESGVYRCRELKKLGCNAFVMFNIDNLQTPRVTNLKRWSKGKCAYWKFDVSDYDPKLCMSSKKTRVPV
jgi:hypothetical protein